MTNTQKITVWKVEDHEGTGECTMCGKTGVRWIVYLSDGSRVGGECAKKIMGWAPTKKTHGWVQGLTAVAEKEVCGPVGRTQAVLYRSESGKGGALSIGGNLQTTGPFEWVERQFTER